MLFVGGFRSLFEAFQGVLRSCRGDLRVGTARSPPFHGPDKEVLAKIRAGKVHWSSKFKRLSEDAQSFVQAR